MFLLALLSRVVFILTLGWWVLWVLLAVLANRRDVAGILAISGIIWAGLGYWSLDYSVFWLLFAAAAATLPGMVRVIAEYERGVLFRFGRLAGAVGAGLNVILPWGIDRMVKVDLRTFTIDVPRQEVITRDNVPVLVDAVVYFNVADPVLAVTKVFNYVQSTTLLGQTILRSVLGQHELDEILSKRAELNSVLRTLLDEATDPWGIKVTAVEIKAIELPETMKRALAKQAEAERERRAKIIAAEGELQASEKLREAARVIGEEPAAIQLRYLQTLSEIAVERNSTILFPLPMELLHVFKRVGQGGQTEGS